MKTNILLLASALLVGTTQLQADKTDSLKNEAAFFIKKQSLKQKEFFAAEETPSVEKPFRHVVKLNLTQCALTNPTIQYEFAFHKNLSVATGFSYLVRRDLPTMFFEPSTTVEGWKIPSFGGWSSTTEFRFYPGKKVEHKAPHGFYLAPYFRYAKYSVKAEYTDIVDEVGSPFNVTYLVKASYGGFTAGGMIGAQWLIGKHFSIDWWILGGGAGIAKFAIEAKAKDGNLNLSSSEQEEVRIDMQENVGQLGSFGAGAVEIETTSNSAKVTVKGLPMTSVRAFGVCLGFAF